MFTWFVMRGSRSCDSTSSQQPKAREGTDLRGTEGEPQDQRTQAGPDGRWKRVNDICETFALPFSLAHTNKYWLPSEQAPSRMAEGVLYAEPTVKCSCLTPTTHQCLRSTVSHTVSIVAEHLLLARSARTPKIHLLSSLSTLSLSKEAFR